MISREIFTWFDSSIVKSLKFVNYSQKATFAFEIRLFEKIETKMVAILYYT